MQTSSVMQAKLEEQKKNDQAEIENFKKLQPELKRSIFTFDDKQFNELANQIKNWRTLWGGDAISTEIISAAILCGNEHVFNYFSLRDLITKENDIKRLFRQALAHGTHRMVDTLVKLYPELLDLRPENENIVSYTIRHVSTEALYRNGKFKDEATRKKLTDWRLGVATQFSADEKPEIKFSGSLDILNLLIFHLGKRAGEVIESPDAKGRVLEEVLTHLEKHADWVANDANDPIVNVRFEPKSNVIPTLKGTIELRNWNNNPRLPITLVYDLSETYKILKRELDKHHKQNGAAGVELVKSELHQRLSQVQENLSNVSSTVGGLTTYVHHTATLLGAERKEDMQRFTQMIANHKNAKEFYDYVKVQLGAFHNYCTGVMGGNSPKDGSLSLASNILEISSSVIGSIPVAGSFLEKLAEAASFAVKKVDTERETNLAKSVALLGTTKETGKVFELVARKLTSCYFQPLEEILATREEAKEQRGKLEKVVAKGKEKLLHENPLSPAQQLAAYVVMQMINDVLNNNVKLEKEIQAKGLAAILITSATEQEPKTTQGLKKFWLDMLSKIQREGLRTKVGNEINPADVITRSGIKTPQYYYSGNDLVPATYGWRLLENDQYPEIARLPITAAPAKIPLFLELGKAAPPVNPELLPQIYGSNSASASPQLPQSITGSPVVYALVGANVKSTQNSIPTLNTSQPPVYATSAFVN